MERYIDQELALTARHEGGHALLAFLRGRKIDRCIIGEWYPDGEAQATLRDPATGKIFVQGYPSNYSSSEEYHFLLAGRAAEGCHTFIQQEEDIPLIESSIENPEDNGNDLIEACRHVRERFRAWKYGWDPEKVGKILEKSYKDLWLVLGEGVFADSIDIISAYMLEQPRLEGPGINERLDRLLARNRIQDKQRAEMRKILNDLDTERMINNILSPSLAPGYCFR